MTAYFVSKRAVISFGTHLVPPLIILGPSRIGSGSILFSYVFLGFPTRRKLAELSKTNRVTLEELDTLSSGSRLGAGVTVRSHCVIYENVELGDEVELGHNVLIRESTVVGAKTKIGTGTIVDGYSIIGDNSNIQSGVYIPVGTRIGNRVFIGPRAVITNDRYPPSKRIVETIIEDDAVIGANSTIVAGARIGRRAVVAAGAVVIKDVDPDTVVAGVPARPIMKREEYEAKKKLYEESDGITLK
ncbi:MAG: DapH/DapD/GlmU-related protein [Sulfolobales archaeon]